MEIRLKRPELKWPDVKASWQDEEQRTRLLFILNGVFINAAVILTSGMFLSGYIVFLGGSDFLVGLMNNSMNWAAIAGLFSYLIFERMARRKTFLLVLLVLSRFLVCSVVYLPLLFGTGDVTLALLTLMIVSGNIIWGVFGIGFTIWMMNSFPQGARSAFIFKRTFWLRIAFTLTNICMGYVLDWSGKSYTGFLIVFSFSLLLSLADAAVLLGVKEPDYHVDRQRRFTVRAFFEPLRNKPYLKFILFIFLYYTSLTISSSFTSLYLVRYLELDFKFISFVTVIANFFMIICIRMWRQAEGKIGLMRAFRLTGLLAALEFLAYVFLNQDTIFLLVLAPILAGIGNSGFNIFVINYRYELMPEENRTLYEGWYGALFGLSLLAGPTIGNFAMNNLPVIENALFRHSRFQLLYLLSFLLAVPILLLAFRDKQGRLKPNRTDKRIEETS
jgi:predicted MFS family arabinose efflux permease